MPKSRKRRRPKQPTTREELLADPYVHAMVAANDAEARGDVGSALSIIAEADDQYAGGGFWRPWRVERLKQIYMLGSLLPRWATSRWLIAQALQSLDPDGRPCVLQAIEIAMDVRGGAQPDLDPIEDRSQITDRDWVFRQLALYEFGGLSAFLRRRAAPDLIAAADRINEWSTAPMRGLRLVDCAPLILTWEDAATGEELETINIGSASLVDDEECVIGRPVPIEEGVMFETAPLVVPYAVARDVAEDPAGWVDILRRSCRDHPATRADTIRTSGFHDFGLLTDVPRAAWEPALSAYRSLAEAVPDLGVDVLPCLAAWLVQPETIHLLMSRPTTPDERRDCGVLADLVQEPAAGLLRELADPEREAA